MENSPVAPVRTAREAPVAENRARRILNRSFDLSAKGLYTTAVSEISFLIS